MKIDAVSRVYCVLGHPVAHSKGPAMHNAAFSATGVNGIYVAFPVKDIAGGVTGLRALDMGGASVTIPHKVDVMKHLDVVDEDALRIGAVNTVDHRDGRLIGYNSDWRGAVRALQEKTSISGKKVMVIGAGGAARAVAYGIAKENGRLLIVNRTAESARTLAGEFGGKSVSPAAAGSHDWDILINTTPVGMTPADDLSPVPVQWLEPGRVVMDIVYNPLTTRLLKDAVGRGCEIIDGLAMFVYQGACQFEIWTGREAPVAVMRKAVLDALTDNREGEAG